MNAEYEPNLGGEDFAFFGQEVPTSYITLGMRNAAKGVVHGLHSPKYMLNEDVLHIGAAYHAALAIEFLAQKGNFAGHDEL